jgi:phytoene synthase
MLDKSRIESLKMVDPDRCRAAVLADAKTRSALLTLYAFHAELAKIPELTSEPMMGAIRYQWWREAVAEIYQGQIVRRHDIALPLADVLRDHDIPRFWVDQLIDGRERDIDPRPFQDLTEAKAYCEATSGTLARTAALICAPDQAEPAAQMGAAWGMTGLLRGWSFYADTMLKEIDPAALSNQSRADYAAAHEALGDIPAGLMPAIGYCALIPGFQKRHHSSHNTVTARVYSPLLKQGRLLLTALTGKCPL